MRSLRVAPLAALLLALAAAPAYAGSAGAVATTPFGDHCYLDAFTTRSTVAVLTWVSFGYQVTCDVPIASIDATSRLYRDGVQVAETAPWHCTSCDFADGRQTHLPADGAAYWAVTEVQLEITSLSGWPQPAPLGCTVPFGSPRLLRCTFQTSA